MQATNPYAAPGAGVGPSGAGLQSMPWARQHRPWRGAWRIMCASGCAAFLSASMFDILEFFKGYNVVQNGVHVVLGPGDRPSGEAFVEFATPEDAARAMEKHRQHVGTRYVQSFRVTKGYPLPASAHPSPLLLPLWQLYPGCWPKVQAVGMGAMGPDLC